MLEGQMHRSLVPLSALQDLLSLFLFPFLFLLPRNQSHPQHPGYAIEQMVYVHHLFPHRPFPLVPKHLLALLGNVSYDGLVVEGFGWEKQILGSVSYDGLVVESFGWEKRIEVVSFLFSAELQTHSSACGCPGDNRCCCGCCLPSCGSFCGHQPVGRKTVLIAVFGEIAAEMARTRT